MTIERGTTQDVRITIKGYDLTGCDIFVTFTQGSAKKLTKKNISVSYANSDSTIMVTLSQEETLYFEENKSGKIQVRWIDSEGVAKKTKTATFNADECLYDAVLEWDDSHVPERNRS